MITKCDHYWWHLNKTYLIILFCTIPFAILFPIISLFMPMVFLYGMCDQFLVFHNCGEKQEDSMRFIMTMPFSRGEIFSTYIKGLAVTSLGYAFVIGLIRLVLSLTKVLTISFWSSNLYSRYELSSYMLILIICLLTTGLFLILLVNNYTVTLKTIYICLSLFLILPVLYILQFLKTLIMFFTGFARMRMGVTYGFHDIVNMGLSEKIASIVSVIIFLILVIALVFLIHCITSKSRKRYQGVGK